jgi:plastocyanin
MKKPIFFSLIITVAMLSLIISCADRLDTYDIIQTTTTEQKLDNDAGTATAIAERKVSMDATAAAGGELDLRPAERAAATAQAEATAAAERGESIQMEDLDRVELTDNLPTEIPSDISPSSETITVQILNEGYYDPEVVVVKVGTSVVWENTQRTPYGILSDEGQDEVFNSGGLRRKLGAKENPTYEYTFTKVGRFTYGPDLSGAAMVAKGRGVIFVVE